MATPDLLPLFPLDVVLLPGVLLPLHIFEPRYREMIGEAIERKSTFGVVLVLDQKLTAAGCTAIVERVTQRYDDGRFDIEARGVRRFTIAEIDQSRAYLQGRVEFFDDEPSPEPDPELVSTVSTLAHQVIDLEGGTLPPELAELTQSAEPPGNLSFIVAGAIRLELPFKQRLLTERSESQRLKLLEMHLPQLTQELRTTRRAQRLAGSNGHPG